MNVTGSTLSDVMDMGREELLTTRHMIGAWNQKKSSEAKGTLGKGPRP